MVCTAHFDIHTHVLPNGCCTLLWLLWVCMTYYVHTSFTICYVQLFARTSKYIKQGMEQMKWSELSFHFMTKESGGEDEKRIVRHELPWTSE